MVKRKKFGTSHPDLFEMLFCLPVGAFSCEKETGIVWLNKSEQYSARRII